MPAKPRLSKDERLRLLVQNAQLNAARSVAGLFKKDGEEGYNPDADKPWKELTGRTRAALLLTQGAMAEQRAKTQAQAGPKTLGVVVVAPRIESARDWERLAADVEAGKPILDAPVVDVDSTPVPQIEEKKD